MPDGTATTHILQPKIFAVLREGYSAALFRRDALAAVTVAIVALPLSMAIAVASGLTPERGLYAAIVGGFVVSALSGSRYQIGGPAGAFIVIVAVAVAQLGLSGFLLAVMLSGVMLIALGLLGIGSLVRFMPHAVTVGFTAGIAVTIAASQLKDLAGLSLVGPEPAHVAPKVVALIAALPTANFWALALGCATAAIIIAVRRFKASWPGMLIAVVFSAAVAAAFRLPVETIGARFGAMPTGLPFPELPQFSVPAVLAVLPTALSFTLLGAVESLLSAKVADAMTGRKHRSNMELIGQGAANVMSAFFGGMNVTGTIARTATNIRAGAATPVSGMLHAAILLAFLLIAAPLMGYIPLASLAGLLLVVCWTMTERAEFMRLLRTWRSAVVLLATFLATLAADLTIGICLGCALAALLAWARRSDDRASS